MRRDELWPGLLVIWRHRPRGGYGFVSLVEVKVLSLTRKRVRIEAKTPHGPKIIVVDGSSLRSKDALDQVHLASRIAAESAR